MRKEKPRCCAKIIMGAHLTSCWASCEIRLKGTCCKDCKQLKQCKNPCSILYHHYNNATDSYDFTGFQCPYFCLKWEAIFKRLDTAEGRRAHK